MKKYEDLLTGIFFSFITLVYASQIPAIKRTKISPADSALIPTVVAICMGALALFQLYTALKKLKRSRASGEAAVETAKAVDGPDYRRAFITLGLSLVYALLFKPLGFIPSTILYLTAQMSVLAPKEQRKPVRFLVIAVIAVVVIYLVFHTGLGLLLPNGILTEVLG